MVKKIVAMVMTLSFLGLLAVTPVALAKGRQDPCPRGQDQIVGGVCTDAD